MGRSLTSLGGGNRGKGQRGPCVLRLGAVTRTWLPLVIAIVAFFALWKYKADIMKVIGVCALLGLAMSFA